MDQGALSIQGLKVFRGKELLKLFDGTFRDCGHSAFCDAYLWVKDAPPIPPPPLSDPDLGRLICTGGEFELAIIFLRKGTPDHIQRDSLLLSQTADELLCLRLQTGLCLHLCMTRLHSGKIKLLLVIKRVPISVTLSSF